MSRDPKRWFSRRSPGGAPADAGSPSTEDGAEGYVTVEDGVRLWYRVVGAGSKTIVVPSTGNDGELAELQVPDHRVLFYDVRSRGRSDPVADAATLGFSVEVTDLEFVRDSFGLETFSILAWSYHAGVVAAYAMQHAERLERLVLVASIPLRAGVQPGPARHPAPHQLAHLDQLEASGLRTADPAAFCRAWREVYVPLLMGERTGFERMAPVCGYPNEHPWNVARSLVHVFSQLRSYDWRPHLHALAVPTLVVHGTEDQDPIERAQEWVDALPEGRLLVMEGVGQFPWVERPSQFFPTVNRFLAGEAV